ncbi:MAG: hypothetical protein R2941_12750 [Desulfobacterales bacterium]
MKLYLKVKYISVPLFYQLYFCAPRYFPLMIFPAQGMHELSIWFIFLKSIQKQSEIRIFPQKSFDRRFDFPKLFYFCIIFSGKDHMEKQARIQGKKAGMKQNFFCIQNLQMKQQIIATAHVSREIHVKILTL